MSTSTNQGIYKIIPGDSQEELIKRAGQLIQVYESSRHIKQAASRMFSRQDLESFAPPKGKFLSHMITMGSSENFGANRNADRWSHEQLKNRHHTFVTNGHNFREHRNSDPKLAVGQIKAAKYDEDLQWGEIVMWTDIDKAAAEFERARAGEEQHGSMAASVKEDHCTCCGFISKNASERCDHIRFTPGAYLPEFRKYAHMDNIEPTFKDYSWVARPADRIAHTLTYLMPLSKAASVTREMRGDELAVLYGMTTPAWLTSLKSIAEFDRDHHEHPAKRAAAQTVLPRAFDGQWPDKLMDKMSGHSPGKVMRSALDRQLVMPLASFNAWITGASLSASEADPVVKAAGEKLAEVRAIILQRVDDEPELMSSMTAAADQFEPMCCGCEDIVDRFMDDARDQFSLRYEALAKRATINPPRVVRRSAGPIDEQAFGLAALYNAYLAKVASQLPDDWMTSAQLAALG